MHRTTEQERDRLQGELAEAVHVATAARSEASDTSEELSQTTKQVGMLTCADVGC